ncbi:unnamed protein product, partial [Oppiella nova]
MGRPVRVAVASEEAAVDAEVVAVEAVVAAAEVAMGTAVALNADKAVTSHYQWEDQALVRVAVASEEAA